MGWRFDTAGCFTQIAVLAEGERFVSSQRSDFTLPTDPLRRGSLSVIEERAWGEASRR
jgi:hypothetical protein